MSAFEESIPRVDLQRVGAQDEARKRHLVYLIAFDGPGYGGTRLLARMLISSLLRTFFTGDIVVFRNTEAPLFLVERKGLQEIFIETPPLQGQECAFHAMSWKYRVDDLIDATGYDKILFLDADMLALRNIDHLLEGDWDIRYQPERGHQMDSYEYNGFLSAHELIEAGKRTGVNSGTMAMRAEIYHDVMAAWREIDEGEPLRPNRFWDQASWNRLLLAKTAEQQGGGAAGPACRNEAQAAPPPWLAEPFPVGEIQFPMYLDMDFRKYSLAALTHNCGGNPLVKIEFTFGLYMRTFFSDPSGLFFSMLEV